MSGCPDCGKIRYLKRRQAKLALKRLRYTGANVYRCGEFWHIGHLPSGVKKGRVPRAVIAESQAAKRVRP